MLAPEHGASFGRVKLAGMHAEHVLRQKATSAAALGRTEAGALPATALPERLAEPLRTRLAQGRVWRLGAPGAQLVCHAWAAPDGRAPQRPVVLLHGGSGSWTHWLLNIVPLLDAGRSVLALDLPGHGDSDAPQAGGGAALVDMLAACWPQLVQAAAGGLPPDLVGFSLGGLTAARLLALHGVGVHRLVLVGAPGMGLPAQPLGLKGWRHLPSQAQQDAVHRHNLTALMLHDARRVDGLALQIHRANVVRDRLVRRRRTPSDALVRCLGQIDCPVHAIYGTHDVLYGAHLPALAGVFAAVAPQFAGLQLIDGAGHWVQFEAAEAFNATLLHALNG